MAKNVDKLDRTLGDMRELEDFLFALIHPLDERKMSQGEDLLPYVKELNLKIPDALKGAEITWEADTAGEPHHERARNADSLVLVRAGEAETLGFTVKCVKVKGWKFCLECGWLYCRIVVTKKF
jgi:hypothetical protein